tara:strand:+ start:838 stop:1128 length:291 start_codon:yes stop_codon:yes gene_type:complete
MKKNSAPMNFCYSCNSFHADPENEHHHAALQCKADYDPTRYTKKPIWMRELEFTDAIIRGCCMFFLFVAIVVLGVTSISIFYALAIATSDSLDLWV